MLPQALQDHWPAYTYARVSTLEQAKDAKSVSLETQNAAMQRFAKQHHLEILDSKNDVRSAYRAKHTSPQSVLYKLKEVALENRKAAIEPWHDEYESRFHNRSFKKLKACKPDGGKEYYQEQSKRKTQPAETAKGILLLVYSFDRLSRNCANMLPFLDDALHARMLVLSVTEPTIDYSTAAGRHQAINLISHAEFQSRLLGDKVRATLSLKRKYGSFVGTAPYGSEKKHVKTVTDPVSKKEIPIWNLQPNEAEWQVIKLVGAIRRGLPTKTINQMLFGVVENQKDRVPLVFEDKDDKPLKAPEAGAISYGNIAFVLNDYNIPRRNKEWTKGTVKIAYQLYQKRFGAQKSKDPNDSSDASDSNSEDSSSSDDDDDEDDDEEKEQKDRRKQQADNKNKNHNKTQALKNKMLDPRIQEILDQVTEQLVEKLTALQLDTNSLSTLQKSSVISKRQAVEQQQQQPQHHQNHQDEKKSRKGGNAQDLADHSDADEDATPLRFQRHAKLSQSLVDSKQDDHHHHQHLHKHKRRRFASAPQTQQAQQTQQANIENNTENDDKYTKEKEMETEMPAKSPTRLCNHKPFKQIEKTTIAVPPHDVRLRKMPTSNRQSPNEEVVPRRIVPLSCLLSFGKPSKAGKCNGKDDVGKPKVGPKLR